MPPVTKEGVMTRLSFVALLAVWTLGSGAIALGGQAKPAPTNETVILNQWRCTTRS